MDENLNEMKLHEMKQYDDFDILRVINGWVYIFKEQQFGNGVGYQWIMTSVFVPEIKENNEISN